jgi:hypothetical protein
MSDVVTAGADTGDVLSYESLTKMVQVVPSYIEDRHDRLP